MKLIGILLLVLLQDPAPVPVPDPIDFECTSTGPVKIGAKIHWDREPFDALKLSFEKLKIESSDVTAPQIVSVTVGTVNVLAGTFKINPLSNGAPLTVTAGDDIAITRASLFVDGISKTSMAEVDGLPTLFYVRWNTRTVAPGPHTFRLVVWDAAENPNEKTWVMTR